MALSAIAERPPRTSAFAELVDTHQAMVFSLAYHFLHDRTAAEEIAQDVFLELHLHLGELQSPEHVISWLRRVAVNRCIDEGRRRKRRSLVPIEDVPEPVSTTPDIDHWSHERLRRLVASLPERMRLVVVLRYQEDLDPEDIAAALRIPVNTVKSQLQRALQMLREKAGAVKR
jgi:RNA polymerase sigma-70 factor, ECF subfamily